MEDPPDTHEERPQDIFGQCFKSEGKIVSILKHICTVYTFFSLFEQLYVHVHVCYVEILKLVYHIPILVFVHVLYMHVYWFASVH